MVWKLLRRHLSIIQFVGFFLANLLGMFIVLLSIQFYQDVKPLFSQEDGLMKKEYMILSKRVSTLGSLVKKSSGFTSEDVDEIKNQPFVKNVGAFTPGHFNVSAGVSMAGGMGMSTQMFFESVPDAYIYIISDLPNLGIFRNFPKGCWVWSMWIFIFRGMEKADLLKGTSLVFPIDLIRF